MRKAVSENCLGTREGIVTNVPGLAAVTAFRDYKDTVGRATNQITADVEFARPVIPGVRSGMYRCLIGRAWRQGRVSEQ